MRAMLQQSQKKCEIEIKVWLKVSIADAKKTESKQKIMLKGILQI